MILFLPAESRAGSVAEDAVETLEASVGRARSLCHGILTTIREIRNEYPEETLDEITRGEASGRLARTRAMVELFDYTHDETKKLEKLAGETISGTDAEPAGNVTLKGRVRDASGQLDTYRRYVDKFYREAVGIYGEPPAPPAAGPSRGDVLSHGRSVPAGGLELPLRVSGEIRGALGTSSYKRPHDVPDPVDNSTGLFEGRIQAGTRLSSGTVLRAELGRENRMEREAFTLTNIGFRARHAFPTGWELDAGIAYRGYNEKEEDITDYGETNINARMTYSGPGPKFRAGIEKRGRSFSGKTTACDYDVTTLSAEGETQFGTGRLFASLSRVGNDSETDGADYSILHPSLTWRTDRSGNEAHFSLEQFRTDSKSADHDRIRGHFRFARNKRNTRGYIGPEIQHYTYPNVDEAGYTDYGFAGRGSGFFGTAGDGGYRHRHQWRAYYRSQKPEDADDFAGFSMSSRRYPRGQGGLREFGLTGTIHVEGEDYDSLGDIGSNPSLEDTYLALGEIVEAFQVTGPPHVMDTHLRIGRVIRPWPEVLQSLEISGTLGHALFVDTERNELRKKTDDLVELLPDSLQDVTPLGETDFLFRNTVNRARWSVRAAAVATPIPLLRGRVSLQYNNEVYYNVDPVMTAKVFDLQMSGEYRFRPDMIFEIRIEHHSTSIGDSNSPNDLNRTEFALRLRYLFDTIISRPATASGGSG